MKKYIDQRYCINCRRDVTPIMPGQGWIELVLWCCYVIPGLLYSIWRRAERNRTVCPRCRNPHTTP